MRPVARCLAVYHQHYPEMCNYVFQLSYTPSITNYTNYPGETVSQLMSIWHWAMIISLAGRVLNSKFTSEDESWMHSETPVSIPRAPFEKHLHSSVCSSKVIRRFWDKKRKKRACGRAELGSTGNNLFFKATAMKGRPDLHAVRRILPSLVSVY